MSFASLGLAPTLLRAVRDQGYHAPTAVQSAALPPILAGADVLALAQTGSGKTAAFVLPLLQRLLTAPPRPGPRALVLAPTRELAMQTAQLLRDLAAALPQRLKIALAFGGVSINPQLMALRGGCDVMVATPGRLLDLIDHNGLTLAGVQCLVLDEADRLLNQGFADELQRLLALLPPQRQSLLFSATFPAAVEALAAQLLREPVRIQIEEAPPQIAQRALQLDRAQRLPALRQLLKSEGWKRALVFVASRYTADLVSDKLFAHGFKAGVLHGELSQGARRDVLEALKAGSVEVLVATDVAARGLHIEALDAVVNYELPRSAADYTHRIGRTGRAGATGVSVSFICADGPENAESHFRLIEKRQGQRVPRERLEGFEPQAVTTEAQATGGIKSTTRKSKKDKLREAAAKAAEGSHDGH
ncbi:superfamily II DNA/RNA helicase [Pelomonas saccharophila]|uniref:Superfamily II DNA/RNA helicase n=1 Tax=Roseateles saccharophilus TaxID=304 RepID=A0ABU1YTC2_ROSSA|nr:DEAD/DEAH box helicase [Roseateles saccharophilus]MDR7272112.1 superfamily II DNA/RNA helicase [Roseateles saccharophilus]